MEFSIKLHNNKVTIVHCRYGSRVIIYITYCISFSEDQFCPANSADPDEMPHYAAFHLSLHCLPKCPFKGFRSTMF